MVYALFPPLLGKMKKQDKRLAYAKRAQGDFELWGRQLPHPVLPAAPLVAPTLGAEVGA